jgi:SAM-dependent methyltransferase
MSMPRAPGRIYADGPPELAEALVAALRAPTIDHEIAESLTHPLHSYPARLHPATARILVDVVGYDAPPTAPLLDPFCGSGTVLVEAKAAGMRAIGVDLSPLAVLIARAKTWTVSARRRREMRETGHAIAGQVLAAGKAARRSGAQPMPQRRPEGFDPNARDRRLSAWFAPHVRRELELIAQYLDELRERDVELSLVLTACLSAILYKVSSRTSDTNDDWVSREIARGAATRNFVHRVDLLEAGLADLPQKGPAEVYELDIRRLAEVVPDGTAAGIVTSPPYAGTYDYAEHQRLRFDFLALRHRELDDGEIGSRRSFDNALVAEKAWRRALVGTLSMFAGALAPNARAAIVIGDSFAGGRPYHALDDLRAAMSDELVIDAWASQERPMLGSLEKRAFADRPKAEHVVLLRKR